MLRYVGIFLMILPFSAAAESVYVIDQLTVGIFSGPDNQPPEVKRAASGDLLEVLERREGAVKVRDASGIEGWIKVNLVTSAKPARLQLNSMRAEAERLKLELDATKAQLLSVNGRLKEAQDSLSNEKNRASDLSSQIEESKSKNEQLKKVSSEPEIPNKIAHGLWFLFSLAMLVGGFIIGYSWVREKYRRKLGGMYLRM